MKCILPDDICLIRRRERREAHDMGVERLPWDGCKGCLRKIEIPKETKRREEDGYPGRPHKPTYQGSSPCLATKTPKRGMAGNEKPLQQAGKVTHCADECRTGRLPAESRIGHKKMSTEGTPSGVKKGKGRATGKDAPRPHSVRYMSFAGSPGPKVEKAVAVKPAPKSIPKRKRPQVTWKGLDHGNGWAVEKFCPICGRHWYGGGKCGRCRRVA